MWIKLDKKWFNLAEDIYIATVYVCPQYSSFSYKSDDVFELLESDLAAYSKIGKCIVLGDFNGRTNVEADFCCDDDSVDKHVKLPFSYIQDVPRARHNQDSSPTNHHGAKLLSLCKTTGLRIVNGRFLGDSNGYFTCFSHTSNPSVIDYALASESLFKKISTFHVNDPSIYSIHCALSLTLKSGPYKQYSQGTSPSSKYFKFAWKNGDDAKLTLSMGSTTIANKLRTFTQRGIELNAESINNATKNITDIISDAARTAGVRSRKISINSKTQSKNVNKKWFNAECTAIKSRLRALSPKLRQQPFNPNLVHEYRRLKSSYKKCLKRSKKAYENQIWNSMENLKCRDPKQFWKLFNELKDLDQQQKSNPLPADQWVEHFSSLLNKHLQPNIDLSSEIDRTLKSATHTIFNELNYHITTKEIADAGLNLKSNKAAGPDGIPNEIIKVSLPFILTQLTLLFNAILNSGSFPDPWRIQSLSSLHKKGDIYQPPNYRGIAVGNSLSKLFLSILHNRLAKFAATHNLIPKVQIGYKKGARTSDHILTLKTIIDKYINQLPRKYLFACFVDFKAAFDSVWRKALFYKLLQSNIGGNFLAILQNMYTDVQYCVKVNGTHSTPFSSTVGVKQGCVLSPILFNLYLSDFPDMFDESCAPVSINNKKLNCLMFADDVVLLSESSEGLQNCLNRLSKYCAKWQLTINLSKTKVVIFNKGGHRIKKFGFTLNDGDLCVEQMYTYLGIPFTSNGSFKQACVSLTDKAK